MLTLTFRTEANRRADSRKPSVLTWYVDWTIDEIRSEVESWLLYDVKVPAILCTRVDYIRDYAPPTALHVVLHPLEALREPIEGYGWLECLKALEDWALGFNEVYR
jgi:hypothetical protein